MQDISAFAKIETIGRKKVNEETLLYECFGELIEDLAAY